MYESEMFAKLKTMIDGKRYQHTIGVVETATRLAEHYGISIEKARIAALLHDCAKGLSSFLLLQRLEGSDIVIDDMERIITPILHGPAGAVVAREEFGVTDPEVLRAIRFHTTGAPDMTLLDKVIYLADYIEPNRKCPGMEELRQLAWIDLDQAVAMAAGRTIIYEVGRGGLIHPRTVETRNALLRKGDS